MYRQTMRLQKPKTYYRHAVMFLLALGMASSAHAGDNPGYDRPGLGFSPAVLAAGDFTWEQSLPDFSHSDDTSLYTADTLLRLGIGGPLELQLDTSYNHLSVPGNSTWGRGDTSIGVKFAPASVGAFGWGVLGSVTFTDGASEFSGGHHQYLLGAAFNWQLDPRNSLGAYLETVRSDGRHDHLIALNAGRALTDVVGGYVEVAWLHTADIGDGSMAGAGLTWQITPRVQLDGSFRHRVGGHADTWQAGLGVSVYFGNLL